jgi:hypothetical protein
VVYLTISPKLGKEFRVEIFSINISCLRTRLPGFSFSQLHLKLGHLDIERGLLGEHLGLVSALLESLEIVFEVIPPIVVKADSVAQVFDLIAGFFGPLPDSGSQRFCLSQIAVGLKHISALGLFIPAFGFGNLRWG